MEVAVREQAYGQEITAQKWRSSKYSATLLVDLVSENFEHPHTLANTDTYRTNIHITRYIYIHVPIYARAHRILLEDVITYRFKYFKLK